MTAVASASLPALSAPLAPSPSTAAIARQEPARTRGAIRSPSRPQLRLPPPSQSDARRHPLKRKWKSFVNFFALPIRTYYLEPPGLAYRNELRARRGHAWDDNDDRPSFWPCPAYTDQVGDDEMVLFKAQEEAEALAALQRGQEEAMTAADGVLHPQAESALSPVDAEYYDALTDDDADHGEDHQSASRSAWSSRWPQTPPEAASVSSFQPMAAGPSPQYETSDPLAASPQATASASASAAQPISTSQRPRTRIRTRTSSNLASTDQPFFHNGVTMSRHLSTPLSPTVVSSSPPTAALSSSLFPRRNRAQTNAARPTLAGRNISEPLSWTLVRSQYSYPKRGLTPEQLKFLSSVESLGRFGVAATSPDVAPSPAYESAPGAGASDYGFPLTPGSSGQQR